MGPRELFHPDTFLVALHQVPARATRGFLGFMAEADPGPAERRLAGLLQPPISPR